MIVDPEQAKIIIAKRIAKEFHHGDLVNLGIGIPMLVPQFLPKELEVTFQSENGMIGMGPNAATKEEIDPNIINAGGQFVTILPHGAFFDTATSFGMIRGGHLDYTVLGALQVDQEGNLANWTIPGKLVPGMGGAMDLVAGAKEVIVATTHTATGNSPKILKRCSLPLTGKGVVSKIITELGLFDITPTGLVLKEIQRSSSVEEIRNLTDAEFVVDPNVGIMDDYRE